MNPEFSDSAEFYKKHLRPFWDSQEDSEPFNLPFGALLPELIATFQKVTGFDLIFLRKNAQIPQNALAVIAIPSEGQAAIGFFILGRLREKLPMLETESATLLAKSFAQILSESYQWSRALCQRETELAILESNTAFTDPLLFLPLDHFPLILKQGARAVGCEAAALYLLNQETTSLKLRSVWGLPLERLTEPARFLGRALADLEALLGNAVILNDPYLMEEWNAPENFSASVCVPVASESAILGTIWFFSDKKKHFTKRDLLVLETVAGRLAAELEIQFLKAEFRKTHLVPNSQGLDRQDVEKLAPDAETAQNVSSPVSEGANPEKEARELLNLLEDHLEKKGNCKNLTLFVVKNSQDGPKS